MISESGGAEGACVEDLAQLIQEFKEPGKGFSAEGYLDQIWILEKDSNSSSGHGLEVGGEGQAEQGEKVWSVKSLQSCLFATLWTTACQTTLSKGFSRQEYWSGLLFPSPEQEKDGA